MDTARIRELRGGQLTKREKSYVKPFA
jgi:hypothetical protein